MYTILAYAYILVRFGESPLMLTYVLVVVYIPTLEPLTLQIFNALLSYK